MATTAYKKTARTGGGASALDGIAYAGILDGDFAYVFVSGVLYHYVYDDDIGGSESDPFLITPDDSGDDGRWVLQKVSGGVEEIIQASTDTLTAAECSGTIINNYGQAAENTQTLPTCAKGLSGTVLIGTAGAGAFHLKAGASDKIYLLNDPIEVLDDGDKASIATPAVGNSMSFVAFQTGSVAYDWAIYPGPGTTVTDGGA